jgi:hypothetical protein
MCWAYEKLLEEASPGLNSGGWYVKEFSCSKEVCYKRGKLEPVFNGLGVVARCVKV